MSINDLYEEQRQQALSILLQKNVLTTCDVHEDEIYEGGDDIQSAYKYANYLFSKGDPSFRFDDRSEMAEAIKIIYEEYYSDMCPSCARHMDD